MDYNQMNRPASQQPGVPQQYPDQYQSMSAGGTMNAQMYAQQRQQQQYMQQQQQQAAYPTAMQAGASTGTSSHQRHTQSHPQQASHKLVVIPEYLADFSNLSVPALCLMGREILLEISHKTQNFFSILRNDKYVYTDVSPHTDYINKLYYQLGHIRCLIEEKIKGDEPNLQDIFESLKDMTNPPEVKKPDELIELEKQFDENRKKLSDISSDLKLLDWTAAVSDPGQLKRVDKLQNNLREP